MHHQKCGSMLYGAAEAQIFNQFVIIPDRGDFFGF